MFFSSIHIFTTFVLWVLRTSRIFKLKTRQNNINERPHHKVKILAFRLVQIYIFIIQYLCSLSAQFLRFGYQLRAFLKASLPLERIWNRECILYHVYIVLFSLQVLFYQTAWSLVKHYGSDISKHEKQCFIGISKHREDSWKYFAQRSIFEEIRGVWLADETLASVWYIFSIEKKLKSKRKK